MNTLELKELGIQELDGREMMEVNGGGIFGAIIGFVVGGTIAIIHGGGSVNGEHTNDWLPFALAGAVIGAATPL